MLASARRTYIIARSTCSSSQKADDRERRKVTKKMSLKYQLGDCSKVSVLVLSSSINKSPAGFFKTIQGKWCNNFLKRNVRDLLLLFNLVVKQKTKRRFVLVYSLPCGSFLLATVSRWMCRNRSTESGHKKEQSVCCVYNRRTDHAEQLFREWLLVWLKLRSFGRPGRWKNLRVWLRDRAQGAIHNNRALYLLIVGGLAREQVSW
jgi:hypothetical protein